MGRLINIFMGMACAAIGLTGCAAHVSAPVPRADVVLDQQSRCLTDAEIAQWVHSYTLRQSFDNPPAAMRAADAACTRAKYQQQLARVAGPLVGYKVDLSTLHLQKTFHAGEPVWGSYYQSMLLPAQQGPVDVRYGSQPVFLANLLVRVSDAGINDAQTAEDVLLHIDQIVPFIELADLQVQKPSGLTAHHLMAINAAARLGVMGQPFAVEADAKNRKRLLRELEGMLVRVMDGKGRLLGRGKGSDVMGHPLRSVVWLAAALRKEGLSLQPGQWISLGALSPMFRPRTGEKVTVAYAGLTGVRPVGVRFQ